ncbi:DUF305 domain-containing protein [Streptomyces sp. p1417]|uniref:DUF305 domain-containing protein n=1 Tax=Streptomyces typhae TaxID=2681492 RepID=A0A6L6WVP1_9ACTN|nr:DUF305 domain-containing protein [Streptomyces typhae]
MSHRRIPASRTSVRRAGAVTVSLAVAVLTLGACDSGSSSGAGSGSGGEAGSAPSAGPSVIVPGKPGETAATLSAKDAQQQRTDDGSPNSADFEYVEKMIPHHGQALEMTALVPARAKSTKVKRLADRITAAQKPEVGAMERWLKAQGKKGERRAGNEGHGQHDHAGMPGMATPAQLKQLRAARGEAFDELFLKLMITHHGGAVTMASDALSEGNNVLVEEMANDVVAQQTSEIDRMRAMG